MTVWFVGGEDISLRVPLLIALRERGFDVGAVGSESGEAIRREGIPYWRYPLKRGPNPIADAASSRHLSHLLRSHGPDVVHAFDTKPTYLVPVAGKRAGIRGRVCTITGMGYLFSSQSVFARSLRPVYRHLQRRACHASSVTIFQNEDDRRYFRKLGMVPPGRDRLVRGSGVDIDRLVGSLPVGSTLASLRQDLNPDGRPVVIMISRLMAHKGIREYMQAAAGIRKRGLDAVFLLAGPAAKEARGGIAVEEILANGAGVRYLGPRTDIPALLSLADVCVLPTYYREGVPRVLLEAGAMGLPLIATDMPGCRDIVRDGWNGLLVRPRDASGLAAGLARLLASREERVEMGRRGRRHVREHFSLSHVADAYAEVYRGIDA
ncbi:MAG: glycosyltransferase family 4 protein [Acidobacteriota bacterium]